MIQNLPLFSSKTLSSKDSLNVKSSTKNSGGNRLAGGLFAFLFALYFVWALAANIQKEALKQHLSYEWGLTLSDEKITTNGFPFKFGIKVSNFQSQLNNTPIKLEFLKLEIIRLIYNFCT